jgi:HD-GYP domain-containing protein (c-di-GMP phosphodiesterase class II)
MQILIIKDQNTDCQALVESLEQEGITAYPSSCSDDMSNLINRFKLDVALAIDPPASEAMQQLYLQVRRIEDERYVYLMVCFSEETGEEGIQGLAPDADEYIKSPLDLGEMRHRVAIGSRVAQLESERRHNTQALQRNLYQTVRTLAHLIEVYDEDLGGHSRRVSRLAVKLARRHPRIAESNLGVIETAGLLHDIGMVGMPKAVFSKKRTEMNSEERKLFLSHPIRGELILQDIESLSSIAKLVRMHHEQVNGLGFPDGVRSRRIPLIAKIISGASIYDNLIHRGRVPLEDVPMALARFRDYQLDAQVVDMLLEYNLEAIQDEEKKDSIEILLDDLQAGMQLANHVRMKSGAIVMPASTLLDLSGINKLKKYYQLECISNRVFIEKNIN